jgi:hypothetical protein
MLWAIARAVAFVAGFSATPAIFLPANFGPPLHEKLQKDRHGPVPLISAAHSSKKTFILFQPDCSSCREAHFRAVFARKWTEDPAAGNGKSPRAAVSLPAIPLVK